MNVAVIVLAAGTSSRMGQPKQLLQYEGKSLVRRAAEVAVASQARQTIVVTGAAYDRVVSELTGLAVMVVHNPEFAAGMSTSLKTGLRSVRPDMDAVVVMLADQPFVTVEIVDAMIDLFEQSQAKVVRPKYGDQPGNPVLWDSSLFPELLEQEGDQGGRTLLRKYAADVAWLKLPDQGQQTDVDTPEAYAQLMGGHPEPAGAQCIAPSEKDAGHPHIGGNRFCTRCATPLEIRPVSYDGNREHPVCPACGWVVWNDPKVAALTVIPWEGGILLGLRRENPGSGRWSFPSGFVDRGEVVEDAAIRETREETGLEIDITGLVGVYSEPGKPVIVVAYAAEVRGGTVQADDDLVELRAYDPRNLPEMAFPHDTQIVADWLALRERRAGGA